ncbi:hypothetical protein BDZ91DRAFT_723883 [Kalaharituber pfeilii]|nr:hypothetical protein BDZ91DRAFT_723883 [Kalaharituber pfeilii]
MTSKDQPSTLKSYVDSATAAIQSAVGTVTGNPNDKAQAERKKQAAAEEHTASHAGAKIGPVSFSNTGEATVDNQERREGQREETAGSVKKAIGNITGNTSLKNEGARQEEEGQSRKAAGQVKDLTSGTADRLAGAAGGGVAAMMGNPDAQSGFQKQHDQGKTKVRGVETDVNTD